MERSIPEIPDLHYIRYLLENWTPQRSISTNTVLQSKYSKPKNGLVAYEMTSIHWSLELCIDFCRFRALMYYKTL